jgi:rieske iron-sulfur protein
MCRDNASEDGGACVDRRRFILLAAGATVGIRHALRARVAWAEGSAADSAPALSDRLVAIAEPQGKTPLRPVDVPLGGPPVMALPFDPSSGTVRDGSRLNRIALVRTDPKALEAAARERAADGVLAFSAVCTHEACFVAGWLPDEDAIVCPCHSSKFNARADGEVLSGPAPRSLPSLPLKIEGGELVIAGPFSSAPGVRRKSE